MNRIVQPAGTLIGGRYRVLQPLGRGGTSVVYRVEDTGTARIVALKQLQTTAGTAALSPRAISHFEHEYQVLAQLAHPRVIAVYDYGIEPAGPFYTMELLEGADLKALAPLRWPHACQLLFEVCSSLALLHSRRLIHRDVSPGNIRCTGAEHAKLIDFGAMVSMGPCSQAVGTPGFAAPEVLKHAELDARTDLFSLGATLYFALTGRAPFLMRELGAGDDAFSRAPVPPSHFARDIPEALDWLCAALLQPDPALRPRSAFEVMQRLAVIAGIDLHEPNAVSRAYFASPNLVGRAESLRDFGQRVRRAQLGEGSALCFAAAPGLGRTRVLEACVLEARTLGVCVLRAVASGNEPAPFRVAQKLAEQLLTALPIATRAAARACGVDGYLLEVGATGSRLRELADPALESGTVQAALYGWLQEICKTHCVLIAVDDVQDADADSQALLAALAIQPRNTHLLLAVTCNSDALNQTRSVLSVLIKHCAVMPPRALTHAETDELFASIFGAVPNLALLADRLFKVAFGNPRETLALVQHLLDAGAITYRNGGWALPAELSSNAVPASATEALSVRVRLLPALARHVLELQALAGVPFENADYARLLPEVARAELEVALQLLVTQAMLHVDGALYCLSHHALAEAVRAQLDDAQSRERHLTLCQFYQRTHAHPSLLSQHLLAAGHTEQALDLLAQNASYLDARAHSETLVHALEHALALTAQTNRPLREAHELRRRLIELALATDLSLHARHAPAWLTRLKQDSGLDDYERLPDTLDPSLRLRKALEQAAGRYASASEVERAYNIQEAIQYLAVYVAHALAVCSRTADTPQIFALPALLQPFAPLNPLIHAVWQNASAVKDIACLGRPRTARRRWQEVYEHLVRSPGPDPARALAVRNAVVLGIGALEAANGRHEAFEWAKLLDDDPRMRVGAMHLRRMTCAMQGDAAGAARYDREAELLAVRSKIPAMFERIWMLDYIGSTFARDLGGIERVIAGLTPLARRYPAWRPLLRSAEAKLQLLCGNAERARQLFEEAYRLSEPERTDASSLKESWISAGAGLCAALTALGRYAEAIVIAERGLAVCMDRGVELLHLRLVLALALAEAKQGRWDVAAERVERVLAEQLECGVMGLRLSASYEVRAQIAVCARDQAAAIRFTQLAVEARAHDPHGVKVQFEPLLQEARAAGLELSLDLGAQGSLRSASSSDERTPQAEAFFEVLRACDEPTRGQRALELLCENVQALAGVLYAADSSGNLVLCATRNAAQPDAEAVRFARGYFAQQLDDASMTSAFTEVAQPHPATASYIDRKGRARPVLLLHCVRDGTPLYAGLAVLEPDQRVDRSASERLTSLTAALVRAGVSVGCRVPGS